MAREMTIGAASRLTGLSVKAIRFYEDEGYIPPAARSEAGYRLFSDSDVQRLRLLRRARSLGVPLPEVRRLVEMATSAACEEFNNHLVRLIDQRRETVEAQIRALQADVAGLDLLQQQVQACSCSCDSSQSAADCDYCAILEAEGGDTDGS